MLQNLELHVKIVWKRREHEAEVKWEQKRRYVRRGAVLAAWEAEEQLKP